MSVFDDEDGARRFKVLINDEGQYSLWPASFDTPGGWWETGKQGTRPQCMAHVDEVWTDMRPRTLREVMDGTGRAVEPG
jgi:MbtH protein